MVSNYVCQQERFLIYLRFVRDGPIEKLWGGGGFELYEFFSLIFPLQECLFFSYARTFFLGYSLLIFFSQFSLA